jgi:serine/threonine protein kinase
MFNKQLQKGRFGEIFEVKNKDEKYIIKQFNIFGDLEKKIRKDMELGKNIESSLIMNYLGVSVHNNKICGLMKYMERGNLRNLIEKIKKLHGCIDEDVLFNDKLIFF